MRSRQEGFTLIEILIVMAIIVTLAGAVMAIIPYAQERSRRNTCANNLRNLGTIMVAESTDKGFPRDSGAAFLLRLYLRHQEIRKDVKVFWCPGDEDLRNAGFEPGSAEHKALFEKLDSKNLQNFEDNISSYAGRNVRDYRIPRESEEKQALACDRQGVNMDFSHHSGGLNVLFTDGKVEFLDREMLGLGPDDQIVFGPGAPTVLEPLIFRVY
jgi:prepilin-type N-terminal cleavage/methylation domain-containing protein/prepilin-type processing-associated H-X9-DG protein